MYRFIAIFFVCVFLQSSACPEPITTVHIQNHDGPIYVSPDRCDYHCPSQLGSSCSPSCGNRSPICDNRSPICDNRSPICDNRSPICDNRSPICDNRSPICDNRSPICDNRVPTCDNRSPLSDTPLIHTYNYPYHTISETDCKCITKQLSTCVPINTVPQSTCTPNFHAQSYPDCNGNVHYPESHGYSEGPSGSQCPIVSEGLIPLFKHYLEQSKNHGCQCGKLY